MKRPAERAQTSFEAMLVAAFIIVVSTIIMTRFVEPIQTTTVIAEAKAQAVNQLAKLNQAYYIQDMEYKYYPNNASETFNDVFAINVRTNPSDFTASANKPTPPNPYSEIGAWIAQIEPELKSKTNYGTVNVFFNYPNNLPND
ncbi:MAG: hypothetical protein HY393_00250 [Candidatus Diapherotrites archaeon]|nr:hypothetical protein [Candidatus Diapherotrites archaeon]